MKPDVSRTQTQPGWKHASCFKEHLLNSHHTPGAGLDSLRNSFFLSWLLAFPRTSGSFSAVISKHWLDIRLWLGALEDPSSPEPSLCISTFQGFSTVISPERTTGNSKVSSPTSRLWFLRATQESMVSASKQARLQPCSPAHKEKPQLQQHVTPLIIPQAWNPTQTEHLSQAAPTMHQPQSLPWTAKCRRC